MYLNLSEFLNVVTLLFGLLGMKIITFINGHMFICVYTCKHTCAFWTNLVHTLVCCGSESPRSNDAKKRGK